MEIEEEEGQDKIELMKIKAIVMALLGNNVRERKLARVDMERRKGKEKRKKTRTKGKKENTV